MPDARIPAILRELRPAARMPHANGSLLTHLVGTWWILTQWGAPQSVCRAGLIHSCYSTQFYGNALLATSYRTRLRSVAGAAAEKLAYQFCSIDRVELWDRAASVRSWGGSAVVSRHDGGRGVRLTPADLTSLLLVESANIADQGVDSANRPIPWMWRLATWHHHLPHNAVPIDRNGGPLLTLAAEQRAIRSYDRAIADGGKRAVAHLAAAIRANPFAGEPRIVRALFRLESGKTATAYADAVRGYELLRAWSVAWDRRKALEDWLELAFRVIVDVGSPGGYAERGGPVGGGLRAERVLDELRRHAVRTQEPELPARIGRVTRTVYK